MTSRDGKKFRRWSDPLIPKTAPKDRGGNRSNYMTWGLVQLPNSKTEYSMYATEAYYTGPDSRVRRFTIRIDGFVSIRAGDKGGVLVTKPFRFRGNKLVLNYAASKNGSIRVEVLDAKSGKALGSFSAPNCKPLRGDSIEQTVQWSRDADVGSLAGQNIRLRFQLVNADLYSMRFAN